MNVRSFSSGIWFSKIPFLLLLTATLILPNSGCSFFTLMENTTDNGHVEPAVKTGAVTGKRIRARKANNTFICLIAEQDMPFSAWNEDQGIWQGAEPEIVRKIADNLKMDVIFVPLSTAALPAALRNGRGDLAAGKLTTEQIDACHLTPAVPYAPAKKGQYALMVRNDDTAWKKALEKAAGKLDGSALLKANSSDRKPASVEVVEKEGNDDTISITVDLKSKAPEIPEKK